MKSLKNQIYPKKLIKIILVDYGSDEKYRKDFYNICQEFEIEGIWTGSSMEVWNKSKCINIALNNATTKYFLVADVDMIYSECTLHKIKVLLLPALYICLHRST